MPLWLGLSARHLRGCHAVGALADWFAVSALFRHIPLCRWWGGTRPSSAQQGSHRPQPGHFRARQFLDAPSLVALIERNNPPRRWRTG